MQSDCGFLMSEEDEDIITDEFSFDLESPFDIVRDFYVTCDEELSNHTDDENFSDNIQIGKGLYSNGEFLSIYQFEYEHNFKKNIFL